MALKGDDDHTPAGEKRHVIDHRQVVGIDIQLELRREVKGIFMQETGVDGVVACHAFYLRGIEHQSSAGFGNVGEAYSSEPGDVLRRIGAIRIVFKADGFRSCGAAVAAEYP